RVRQIFEHECDGVRANLTSDAPRQERAVQRLVHAQFRLEERTQHVATRAFGEDGLAVVQIEDAMANVEHLRRKKARTRDAPASDAFDGRRQFFWAYDWFSPPKISETD